MGASLGGGSGGGRKSRYAGRFSGRNYAMVSEINVTPLVDVMLVLLIVFMVAAPMLTVGVPLDLPKTSAKPLPTTQDEPLTISVKKDGVVFVQKTEVPLDELALKVEAILETRGAKKDEKIFLRADKETDYGAVMKVMAELNIGGFSKIGLITAPKE